MMFGAPYRPKEIAPLQLPENFHDKPKKKHGLAKGIAGTIGDYLMQQQGMAPVYAPTMARQREIEQAQQLYNQQRRDGMQDWIAREQWKLENEPPQAPAPTSFQKNYEWLKANGYEQQAEDLVRRETNPDVYIDPRTGIAYPVGGSNRPAIGSVIADPRQGGPAGNGGGNFR